MPKHTGNFKLSLDVVDIFLGGRRYVYLTRTEKATEAAKLLLKGITLSLRLRAFKVTTDHRSLQKPPERWKRHYRPNESSVHLGNPAYKADRDREPYGTDSGGNTPGSTFETGPGTPD